MTRISSLCIVYYILYITEVISGGNGNGGRPCDENAIYDTMIVYGIDETINLITTPFLEPMDSARNTLAFRTRAYDYFNEMYGLEFDPTIPGEQNSTEPNTERIQVQPLQLNANVDYNIYAYNNPLDQLPSLRSRRVSHRLPVTNAKIIDSVYMVQGVGAPTASEVTWTYNGDTFTLSGNQGIVYGSYRIKVDDVEVTDEATDIYFNSDFADALGIIENTGVVNCVLNSTVFGIGQAFGNGRVEVDFTTFDANVRSKNVMTFASTIQGTTGNDDKVFECRNMVPR